VNINFLSGIFLERVEKVLSEKNQIKLRFQDSQASPQEFSWGSLATFGAAESYVKCKPR
jgi:hypothetical protein